MMVAEWCGAASVGSAQPRPAQFSSVQLHTRNRMWDVICDDDCFCKEQVAEVESDQSDASLTFHSIKTIKTIKTVKTIKTIKTTRGERLT